MFSSLSRFFKITLLAICVVLFAAFAVVNREIVTVSLFPLPYTADLPKFLFAMVCFALGVVVAGLVMSLRMAKKHRQYASEHKRAQALENEVKGLRSAPIAPLTALDAPL